MSYFNRHATVAPDQSPHAIRILGTELLLQTLKPGSDEVMTLRIELDQPGLTGSIGVDYQSLRHVVIAGAESADVTLVTEYWAGSFAQRIITHRGAGAGGCFVRPLAVGCEIYVQRPPQSGLHQNIVDVYDMRGITRDAEGKEIEPTPIRQEPMPYASEGIHHIHEPSGQPVSEDMARGPLDIIPGVQGWRIHRASGYSIWQAAHQPGGVGVGLPNGEIRQIKLTPGWNGYTDRSCSIAPGRRVWCAIPGLNTPEPYEAALEAYEPFKGVPVDPPVVVPPVIVPPIVVPPVVTPPVPPVPPVVVPPVVVVPPTPPVIVPPVVTPQRQPRWLRNLIKWLGW